MPLVQFAPLRIPFSRRAQTTAVLCCLALFLFGHVGSWLTLLVLSLALPSVFVPLVVLYLSWAFYWDRRTPAQGGRPLRFMRRLAVWRLVRDYFPIALRRDAELDPRGTYVFGSHPHGVASAGAVCNFLTDVTGFDRLFPGIDVRLLTLDVQFDMPIWRELLMALGMCSVSKASCLHCLESGVSVVIVVGGAAEALDARPGSADLTLVSRRGFVKIALCSGASLVPTFSFGENDLYNQIPNPQGSRLRGIQQKFTKKMGFSPPLFHGRGIFNYSFGLLPHRHPVTTVVGKPIPVQKAADPDNLDRDEVDRVWRLYVDGLRELFDAHKLEFGFSESDQLNIK